MMTVNTVAVNAIADFMLETLSRLRRLSHFQTALTSGIKTVIYM